MSTIEEAIALVAKRLLTLDHPPDRDLLRRTIVEHRDKLDWERVDALCEQHETRELLDEIRRSIPPI
ncbi:MAG: hypothetical protein U0790_06435 [Isosphaeraceae bacterium]